MGIIRSQNLQSPLFDLISEPTSKMKVFFVLALVAVWMGGINAASIPEPAVRKGEILSDEQIALIIVEVLEQSKAYGILDIVTHLPGLIADLKPIIMKYVSIIMGSLSLQEKL